MNRIHFYLCLLFSIYFTNAGATQYHTISGGGNPNWSHTQGGPDCNCSPQNWPANDTLVIHHSVNRSASNVSWGNAGRLVIEAGGVLKINGNNRSIPMGGDETFVIKDGGELSVGNNFTIVLNSGNPHFEIEEGGIITAGNNFSITLNDGEFIGNGNVEANDLSITLNNSTTYMEVNGNWDIQNALNLTMWGSSTDETFEVNGLITSGSISGTNQTNITGTGAIVYNTGSINNAGALNGCTSCNTDSPVYLGGISPSGELSDVTLWDGNNWSNGTPTSILNAVIFGEFIANAGFTAKSLAIANGAELVVASGEYIEVSEGVDNAGVLKLENQAALVQTGTAVNTGDGTYIVEKAGFSASANNFNVWAAPMPGQQITEVFDLVNLYDIFVFDAQNQQWKYDYGTLTPSNNTGQPFQFSNSDLISGANGIMNPGTGYFIPGNAVKPARVFEGNSVHNGDISVPVYAPGIPSGNWTGSDWNLIGNPYPSGLSVSDFINQNTSIITNCIYLYNNADGSYLSCNNSDDSTLTAGQGFWVQASSNGTVEFNNAMREFDAGATFRSGGIYAPAVYLNLNTGIFGDALRVYISDLADDGIDNLFDANKMQNANGTNFYSLIDSGEYVFQSVAPPSIVEDKRIPLAVEHHTDTTLSISADSVTAGSPYRFFLHDKKQSQVTELKKGVEVEFDYVAGSDQYRFELLVKLNQSETAPEDARGDLNPQVISSTGRFEILNSTPRRIKTARVYDLSGREVVLLQNIESGDVRQTPQLKSGIFIVRFEYDNGEIDAEKVYVK